MECLFFDPGTKKAGGGFESGKGDWGVGSASPQSQMTILVFVDIATCTSKHIIYIHYKYIYIYICIYIYMYIYTCTDMYCTANANEIKKREGGIGGRAQRLPPKQNDTICFHRQCYR